MYPQYNNNIIIIINNNTKKEKQSSEFKKKTVTLNLQSAIDELASQKKHIEKAKLVFKKGV
jgi:hypothetical protein